MFSPVVRVQSRALALKFFSSMSSAQARALSSLVQQRSWQIGQYARTFSAGVPRQTFDEGDGGQRQHNYRSLTYRRPQDPTKTAYVGNIPYTADENQIHALVSSFGQIEDIRVGFTPDGRSRGYAHIDFADIESANAFVTAYTNEPVFLEGRQLRVDFAPGRSRSQNPPTNKLFAMEFKGTQEDLHKAFAEYSEHILSTQMLRNSDTGRLTGQCFIEFETTEQATSALEKLNETVSPTGYKLFLAYAIDKKGRMRSGDYRRQ